MKYDKLPGLVAFCRDIGWLALCSESRMIKCLYGIGNAITVMGICGGYC